MTWAYKQNVSTGAKFVLVTLANFADGNGVCFPGQQRLCSMTGQGERSVRRHLEQLELLGIITIQERRRADGSKTSNLYQLHTAGEKGPTRTEPPSSASGQDGRLTSGQKRQHYRPKTTGSPANLAGHEPPVNHQSEPSVPPLPPQASSSEPPAPGEGEILSELGNENSLKTLQRTQPGIWSLFEELAKIQGTHYRAKLAQATAVLTAIEEHGADAVGSAMRTIIRSAGDGGPLFGRVMALLSSNPRASPPGNGMSRADERLARSAVHIRNALRGGDLN